MAVVIKNVSAECWNVFKSEAARKGLKMGEFFESLVGSISSEESGTRQRWNTVLKGKSFLNEKDAEEMKQSCRLFRKSFTLRSS